VAPVVSVNPTTGAITFVGLPINPGAYETDPTGIKPMSGGTGTGVTLQLNATLRDATTLASITTPKVGDYAIVLQDELHASQRYRWIYADYQDSGTPQWAPLAPETSEGRDFESNPIQTIEIAANAVTSAKIAGIQGDETSSKQQFDDSTTYAFDTWTSKVMKANNWFNDQYNVTTGHDHDGTDSKKISFTDLTDTAGVVIDTDYNTMKTKIEGIEDNAQVNKIETVKLNGTELSIVNKTVDVEVAVTPFGPNTFGTIQGFDKDDTIDIKHIKDLDEILSIKSLYFDTSKVSPDFFYTEDPELTPYLAGNMHSGYRYSWEVDYAEEHQSAYNIYLGWIVDYVDDELKSAQLALVCIYEDLDPEELIYYLPLHYDDTYPIDLMTANWIKGPLFYDSNMAYEDDGEGNSHRLGHYWPPIGEQQYKPYLTNEVVNIYQDNYPYYGGSDNINTLVDSWYAYFQFSAGLSDDQARGLLGLTAGDEYGKEFIWITCTALKAGFVEEQDGYGHVLGWEELEKRIPKSYSYPLYLSSDQALNINIPAASTSVDGLIRLSTRLFTRYFNDNTYFDTIIFNKTGSLPWTYSFTGSYLSPAFTSSSYASTLGQFWFTSSPHQGLILWAGDGSHQTPATGAHSLCIIAPNGTLLHDMVNVATVFDDGWCFLDYYTNATYASYGINIWCISSYSYSSRWPPLTGGLTIYRSCDVIGALIGYFEYPYNRPVSTSALGANHLIGKVFNSGAKSLGTNIISSETMVGIFKNTAETTIKTYSFPLNKISSDSYIFSWGISNPSTTSGTTTWTVFLYNNYQPSSEPMYYSGVVENMFDTSYKSRSTVSTAGTALTTINLNPTSIPITLNKASINIIIGAQQFTVGNMYVHLKIEIKSMGAQAYYEAQVTRYWQ
jgi:hypothetical protein